MQPTPPPAGNSTLFNSALKCPELRPSQCLVFHHIRRIGQMQRSVSRLCDDINPAVENLCEPTVCVCTAHILSVAAPKRQRRDDCLSLISPKVIVLKQYSGKPYRALERLVISAFVDASAYRVTRYCRTFLENISVPVPSC
jgi:hypothetical protein